MNKNKLTRIELAVFDKKGASQKMGVVLAREKGDLYSIEAKALDKVGVAIPEATIDPQAEGYLLVKPEALKEALQELKYISTVVFIDTPTNSHKGEISHE
jgi:hypothetical protein